MKIAEKNKAIELRSKGMSVGKISKELGISKGSISLWVKNVILTKEQKKQLFLNQIKNREKFKAMNRLPKYTDEELLVIKQNIKKLREEGKTIVLIATQLNLSQELVSKYTKNDHVTREHLVRNALIGSKNNQERCRQNRLNYQEIGKNKAKENDPEHKAMCMLYWAEGSKTRNSCIFTNSDKFMMKYFLTLLRKQFMVKNDDITIKFNVHVNNGIALKEIEKFWLKWLELPEKCLRKSCVDTRNKETVRTNKLYYGVCSLQINKTEIIQHIYGAIQEYVGFENNEWLDK